MQIKVIFINKARKRGLIIQMISKNERKLLEFLFENQEGYSINELARKTGISVGSAHLILKEWDKEGLVIAQRLGNSISYRLQKDHGKIQLLLPVLGKRDSKKRTKILGTLGPACRTAEKLRELLDAGVNAVRINGSHATKEDIEGLMALVRSVDSSIPILLDIPGAKIRLRELAKEMRIEKDQEVIFSSENDDGALPVDTRGLHKKVLPGMNFSMDDGTLGFIVESVDRTRIICRSLNSGIVRSRKGINIPDIRPEKDALSARDRKLLLAGLEQGISFVGVSFIQEPKQIDPILGLLKGTPCKLISKIETKAAMSHYREIISLSYGVMIDRGDLGAEVGLEKIPRLQKRIIAECNRQGKPIIVATQMLDSMTQSLYPTKAEITDVANAVIDGASALMLSAETAVGKYPLETVKVMSSIIRDIESDTSYHVELFHPEEPDITDVMGSVAAEIIQNLDITKVVCVTSGGYSARMLARRRLPVPILAVTNKKEIESRLHLIWGVTPVLVSTPIDHSGNAIQKKSIIEECIAKGELSEQDVILLIAAVFPNNRKITNMIEVHKVSELLGYFGGRT